MSKTTKIFKVKRSPWPFINKLLRSADLAEGISINGVSEITEIIKITWKDGEIVDNKRIEKTKLNIRNAFEQLGYDVYSVIPTKKAKND